MPFARLFGTFILNIPPSFNGGGTAFLCMAHIYMYKKAFSRSINEGGRIRMLDGKRGGSSDVVTRNFII